jgi:hypothetical protein
MMAKANVRNDEYCREELFVGLDCWKVKDYCLHDSEEEVVFEGNAHMDNLLGSEDKGQVDVVHDEANK